MPNLTVRFDPLDDQTYRLELASPDVGERRGHFRPPFDPAAWAAIGLALEPGFRLEAADEATQAALRDLGDLRRLPQTAGAALAAALLAEEEIRAGFEVALGLAEGARQPLPLELHFGQGSDALAALPWELLHHKGRFLVADTSLALHRYPEGTIPPTPALAELPLRALLILSEPAGASPIFPERARGELLHGLRALDEAGAVIVDELRPPTFPTLVEAVRNGGYHLVIFYGHGQHDPETGGRLLFEDEFGGGELVGAAELGSALRNTGVRLVLLGACQSAQVGPHPYPEEGLGVGAVWRATAPALLRAGVPLAVGMQVSMRVDAALAFLRQFALSLAAGKPVVEAVADARLPLIPQRFGGAWFIPALYGRPRGDTRLFDPARPLPPETADLRAEMQSLRIRIAGLEKAVAGQSALRQAAEIEQLRAARQDFARARAALARRTPGGYAPVTSPLYGVPSNPVFVGRADELRRVGEGLAGQQPAVIWGPGGIGKTALAVEAAHRQGWRFPAGVLWLDCRGGPALDTLLGTMGAFCGLEGLDRLEPDQKPAAVRAALAGLEARCLLVWDNAEEVWEDRAVRGFIEALPPNCQVLLTTRRDPERAMWPTIELAPLPEPAMIDLFLRLAGAAGVKVAAAADLELIDPIVAWLQGHPLALELVVPLAKRRGLRRVWDDLQRRPLKGVAAAFEASYARLTAAQQRLFTRLSVFTIPFEWEAAAALAGPDEEEADELLDALVQRALVGFDGARYAYHALLRQYAFDKLREMEDPRPVHRRAAEYLNGKLTDPERGGSHEEALEEVDQWERAEEWERFAREASALVGGLDRLGYWGEIRLRLERAGAAVEAHLGARPDLAAGLLHKQAVITYKSGYLDEAARLLEEAGELYRAIGDEAGLAGTLGTLGLVCRANGEWDRAIELYEQSLETSERLGDPHGVAQMFGSLGNVYAAKGEWDRAIEFYQKDLEISERLGDPHGLAQTYSNLGSVYFRQGEWDRAIDFYQQAGQALERLGDLHGMAGTFGNLGLVYADKGEWARAIKFHEKTLEICERLGDPHGLASALGNLGSVYHRQGEWDRAIEFFQRSLSITERMGDWITSANQYDNLGLVYAGKGEPERAIEFYQKALETKERLGDPHGLAKTYSNLGLVYAGKGEPERAIEFYQQALEINERLGDPHGLASTLGNLGNIYAGKGEPERAIEFYQKALEIMERLGDQQGLAYTSGNLGLIHLDQGDLEEAERLFRYNLGISQQLGDVHSTGLAFNALGTVYGRKGDLEQAAFHFARAYRILARLGSREANKAAQNLVRACGSVEAANAYLAQLADDEPPA